MKILITGGTGMLGSAIIRLYHQHHDLHFIGRNAHIVKQLTEKYPVTGHILDLCDSAQLIELCQNMDAIIHCAALSSPWGTYQEFYQANVIATENLLTAAEKNNVPTFIHISTTAVYFNFKDRRKITEQDSVAFPFCNDYANTKYQAEQKVLASSIKSVILRPRGIFGPNDRAIVPRLLSAVRGRFLILPSARNPVVDITYVDNVAEAVLLACQHAPLLNSGEIFNISNDQPTPLHTILSVLLLALQRDVKIVALPYFFIAPIITLNEKIRHFLPHRPEPKITRYSAGLLNYHQTLSNKKARELLGYQPKVTINEGIRRYVQWTKNKII